MRNTQHRNFLNHLRVTTQQLAIGAMEFRVYPTAGGSSQVHMPEVMVRHELTTTGIPLQSLYPLDRCEAFVYNSLRPVATSLHERLHPSEASTGAFIPSRATSIASCALPRALYCAHALPYALRHAYSPTYAIHCARSRSRCGLPSRPRPSVTLSIPSALGRYCRLQV